MPGLFEKFKETQKAADLEKQQAHKENVGKISEFNKKMGITQKPGAESEYEVKPPMSEGYIDKDTQEFIETKKIPAQMAKYSEVIEDPAKSAKVVKNLNIPGKLKGIEKREEVEAKEVTPEQMKDRYDSYTEDIDGLIDYYKEFGKSGESAFADDIASDGLLMDAALDYMVDNNMLGENLSDEEKNKAAAKLIFNADKSVLNNIRNRYHDIIKKQYFWNYTPKKDKDNKK